MDVITYACWWKGPPEFFVPRYTSNPEEVLTVIVLMWHTVVTDRVCTMYFNGPLTRCIKLRVAHEPGMPGMPGTSSPPRLQRQPLVNDPDMHQGTCVTHVPWCMSGSLTRGGEKTFRHSRRLRNPQFYVSDKRPMETGKYNSGNSLDIRMLC